METQNAWAFPRPNARSRKFWAAVVAVTIATLVGSGLAPLAAHADTAPPKDVTNAPETVSSDPLPTVQINGVVWSQAVVGDWVYVGGDFSQARPAGSALGENETPRSNFLRYNLQTGELDPTFDVPVAGVVRAVKASPDGSRVYIGGSFSQVGAETRYRLAAIDTKTGTVVKNFTPGVNSAVYGIEAINDLIYITGPFTQVNKSQRARIAAIDARTSAVVDGFNAVLDGGANPAGQSVVANSDGSRIVVAGSFTRTNGSTRPGRGMAMLDGATGASLPMPANDTLHNADSKSSMMGLASDGDSFYGTGYSTGGDGYEGSFRASWSTGALVWMEDCHGDSYDIAVDGNVVYKASHTHYCENIGEIKQESPWYYNHATAFSKDPSDRKITKDTQGYSDYSGQVAGRLLHWYPIFATGKATGQSQATWNVEAAGDYILYGGEFPRVQGAPQQGLVRFAKKQIAPNKQGPVVTDPKIFSAAASSARPNQARVRWTANYDSDNAELTYQVFRKDQTAPVGVVKAQSTRWVRPALGFTDTSVKTGQSYEYRVRVTDPFGNFVDTPWTSVTVAANGEVNDYNLAVLDSLPRAYWPLDDTGTTGLDWAGSNDLQMSNVGRREDGQVIGQTSYSSKFKGPGGWFGSDSFAATKAPEGGLNTFSIESWFKTSSTSGGKIVGFGAAASGGSNRYDRHLYLSNNGTLSFGVSPAGVVHTVSSGKGLNDNNWHHAVGTVSENGMELYVDGRKVATDPTAISAESYNGYWRIGGDNLGGWPDTGSDSYLKGQIADVAVYDRVLTKEQINAHWVASGRDSRIPTAPLDAYGQSVYASNPSLYWRLSDSSDVARDASPEGGMPGRYQSNGAAIGRDLTGALNGVKNGSVRFSPTTGWFGNWSTRQTIVSQTKVAAPSTYAIEGWFKTSTSAGGKLIGFGDSDQNTVDAAGTYDRHLYMSTNGKLTFGSYNNGQVTLSTPNALNDSAWHYVVAQQSGAGMELFVDGKSVAKNSTAAGSAYNGYWMLGGGSTWSGAKFWTGSLDEVAVYPAALSAAEIANRYQIGETGKGDAVPVASFVASAKNLDASFDASASADAEGPIASYDWDFGDGSHGTGVTATHTYAAAGTYTVSLTVTDGAGQTNVSKQSVVTTKPIAPPVAGFGATVKAQTVSVDGSASVSPDGEITAYKWDFGDGATGTGKTATHTYADGGNYTVHLTVTDSFGANAEQTKVVSVEKKPVQNTVPVAAFTSTVDNLTIAVDGSTSTDANGHIESYTWAFGDGATATGMTASHTYAAEGTYTVSLTVTDDAGATNSTSASVQVGAAQQKVLAKDGFERNVQAGWGSADVGGAWSLVGGNAAFSAGNGRGAITLSPSFTREARLNGVATDRAVSTVTFNTDQASQGGAASATLLGRVVGANSYSARVRFEANGDARLYLLRNETALGGASALLPGGYKPGQDVTLQLAVEGTSPTKLGVKMWHAGDAVPAKWQLSATDETAALQAPGSLAFRGSMSSLSTVPSTVLSIADYSVTDGLAPVDEVPVAPTAAFTSKASELDVAFDASASAEGSSKIVSYDWNFGDGASGTGISPEHSYAQAGTYTVQLVLTDEKGKTATVSHDVVAKAAPVAGDQIAVDEFDRADTTGAWGTAASGGSWKLSGGASDFSVKDGQGVMTLSPSWSRGAVLDGVKANSTDTTAVISSDSQVAGAGAASFTLQGRVVDASAYQARVRFETNGAVRLYVMRDETALTNKSVTLASPYVAGTKLNLRVAVTGTNPTTVSAKIWPVGTDEPADWQISATDSTPGLQAAGSVGVRGSLSAAITTPSVQLMMDRLVVKAAN